MHCQVYLPAIVGYVPDQMVQAISAFLDFCYLVRRSVISEDTLVAIADAIARFHHHREIFRTTGIRADFSLPRQHSAGHYPKLIQMFGAPNGLCSSITESKHIKAVKKPWRRSSRHNALGQMLLTNQRLDKFAAARVDFTARGMLNGSALQVSRRLPQAETTEIVNNDDGEAVEGTLALAQVKLAKCSG